MLVSIVDMSFVGVIFVVHSSNVAALRYIICLSCGRDDGEKLPINNEQRHHPCAAPRNATKHKMKRMLGEEREWERKREKRKRILHTLWTIGGCGCYTMYAERCSTSCIYERLNMQMLFISSSAQTLEYNTFQHTFFFVLFSFFFLSHERRELFTYSSFDNFSLSLNLFALLSVQHSIHHHVLLH